MIMIMIIISSLLLANTYMHYLLYMLGMIKSWWKLLI